MKQVLSLDGAKKGSSEMSLLKFSSKKEGNNNLFLLQMPSNVSVSSLRDSRIMAPSGSHTACLVLEETNQSFSVSRVETSNAWILLPPTKTTQGDSLAGHHVDKKIKLTKDGKKDMREITTHVFNEGVGASFWELKPHELCLKSLTDLLPTWNPYETDTAPRIQGKTLEWLSLQLQCTESIVRKALQQVLFAVCLDGKKYVLLEEEAQYESHKALLATLLEEDDCNPGELQIKEFIPKIKSRIPISEQYRELETVLQEYTIPSWSTQKSVAAERATKTCCVSLDMEKIALFVARELFKKQSIWEESNLMAHWQAGIPTAEPASPFQVSTSLLTGIATRDGMHWESIRSTRS